VAGRQVVTDRQHFIEEAIAARFRAAIRRLAT
jgi:hypothetical protein